MSSNEESIRQFFGPTDNLTRMNELIASEYAKNAAIETFNSLDLFVEAEILPDKKRIDRTEQAAVSIRRETLNRRSQGIDNDPEGRGGLRILFTPTDLVKRYFLKLANEIEYNKTHNTYRTITRRSNNFTDSYYQVETHNVYTESLSGQEVSPVLNGLVLPIANYGTFRHRNREEKIVIELNPQSTRQLSIIEILRARDVLRIEAGDGHAWTNQSHLWVVAERV